MNLADLLPRSDEAKFLHLSYNDRWEPLKPVIVQLYIGTSSPGGKSMTMRQVADFMRNNYSFNAAVNQYSHRFRTWGVRKRILASEKTQIVSALGRRVHPGASTSMVTIKQGDLNKPVDTKQLKRRLKDQVRRYQAEPMVPGVLSSWNLPYAAFVASHSKQPDQPSPFGTTGATPSYLNIQSPEAMTPGQSAGLSPSMQLVHRKVIQDRSILLLQGRVKELLTSCGTEDRMLLTDYLHDFYVHSFVTAKYWGRGPRFWTGRMISALTLDAGNTASPLTPASGMGPPTSRNRPDNLDAPTQLCRWSIHVIKADVKGIPEALADEQGEFDFQDPSSWSHWPDQPASAPTFSESLEKSITNGTFTHTPPEDLPVSTQVIGQSLQKDPKLLQVDACKFAIMAGNLDLLWQLYDEGGGIPDGIEEIHPLHLAAAFLDGGKTCCSTIKELFLALDPSYVFDHNIDNLGHTVLDALMISILRSHTSVYPAHVSPSFGDTNRYPGEEKDICGRWDGDSPSVRKLFQSGYSRIPTEWKHPFCHTAAQAVCHAAVGLFASHSSPDIDTPSGLFRRRCSNCGLELKLGPLHSLVIVAFYLAHMGMQDETMFGVLALLVCLLRLGADVSLTATVSIEDIIGTAEQPGKCNHRVLSACDLMEAVPQAIISRWSRDCQTGWFCILQTFHLAKRGKVRDGDDEPERRSKYRSKYHSEYYSGAECELGKNWDAHRWLRISCGNPELGLLWAAIQVELLTYRRLEDGGPWISSNFCMRALRTWLEGESVELQISLVERRMMKDHALCGWFYTANNFVCPVAEEVCREPFTNMDAHSRTSFLGRPDLRRIWAELTRRWEGA